MKNIVVILSLFLLSCSQNEPKFRYGDVVLVMRPSNREVFLNLKGIPGTIIDIDNGLTPLSEALYIVSWYKKNEMFTVSHRSEDLQLVKK